MEKVSNLVMAHYLLGAPLVTEKNGFKKELEFFFKI